MKLKNFSKKFILAITIFSIIFTTSGIIFVGPAKATGIPVVDAAHIVVTTYMSNLQILKDYLMDELKNVHLYVRDIIVRIVVKRVSDEVVKWVQGGDEPQFITDWQRYNNDAYSQGENQAWNEIRAGDICPEFRDDLQRMLKRNFSSNPKPSQSGWIEYLKCDSSSGPQNNLYGAYTMIQNQMAYQGTARAQAAQNEAIAGKGFISPRECIENEISGDKNSPCIRERITTPGNTVSDIVSKALGSDIEYITNIQSWMGALINGIITKLLQGDTGLSGMSTDETTYNYGGDGSDQSSEIHKQELITNYQKLLTEEQTVLNTKKESLKIANEILAHCYSSSNIQQKIDTLNQDITKLESIVNHIETLITEVEALTPENYSSQILAVETHYQEFMAGGGEQIYIDATMGTARDAAQQELQELQQNQQWCSVI